MLSKKIEASVLAKYIEGHWPHIEKVIHENVGLLPGTGKDAAEHILSVRGKRIRPALLLLSGEIFELDPQKLYPLAAAIELVHTASLLHDDIEDESSIRRGKPAAHELFGPKGALLAGDSLLAIAMCICSGGYTSKICKCLSAALLKTVNGQIKELAKTGDLPNYFESTLLKTGSLMGCACEMAAIFAEKSRDICCALREFGENLGVAYQIADDWNDFLPSGQTGKNQCRDLQKGNLTLPVRLFLENISQADRNKFITSMQNGVLNEARCQEICRIAHSEKIASTIFDQINLFSGRAKAKLDFLPASEGKEFLLHLVEQTSKPHRDIKCLQN